MGAVGIVAVGMGAVGIGDGCARGICPGATAPAGAGLGTAIGRVC